MKKKLPVGVSDFKKVIDGNYYYVDKSLFIKELFDSGSETLLLLRPRRFGKTLNISMLKYYFEKRNDIGLEYMFHNLEIWHQDEEYTAKQGRYPVIYLTFKDIKSNLWKKCYEHLKRVIAEEYRRHSYLLKGNNLDIQEKLEFKKIIGLDASEAAYELSLKNLSEYLSEFYNEKVFVLIDEYDAPIQSGYVYGYYDEVINFMRNVLGGVLKDNSSLEKGVLTGILRIAKESIFSGLNNLGVYTVMDSRFSDKFGLLEEEISEMLKYYNMEYNRDIDNWYNGYKFGAHIVYNPWSIINYLDRGGQFGPYWVNTSNNDIVKDLITKGNSELKTSLEALISDNSIRKQIRDDVIFKEIYDSPEAIWSFLLFGGYLNADNINYDINIGQYMADLRIPNLEVKSLFQNIIKGWFEKGVANTEVSIMLSSLVNGNTSVFSKIFKDMVEKIFSYFDTGDNTPERFYHAFVLGLLVNLKEEYLVKSNRESGYGRYDVMLIPKDRTKLGIIMEFKKVDFHENEDLEKAAEAALKQIDEMNYVSEIAEHNVSNVLAIGFAFEGKKVLIRSKKL